MSTATSTSISICRAWFKVIHAVLHLQSGLTNLQLVDGLAAVDLQLLRHRCLLRRAVFNVQKAGKMHDVPYVYSLCAI